MATKLTPMERALLDTLEEMTTAAQTRDKMLNDKIDGLTQRIQQHETSVTILLNLLGPFLPKGSSALSGAASSGSPPPSEGV